MSFKEKDRIHLYYRKKSIKNVKKRLIIALPILIFLIYIFNNFILFGVTINDGSMETTIKKGQTIFFEKTSLGFRWPFTRNHPQKQVKSFNIEIGTIIAFENPYSKSVGGFWQFLDIPLSILSLGLINLDPRQINVKRVVGLPGETLKIVDKQVYLNGKRLDTGDKWKITYKDNRVFSESISTRDNVGKLFIPSGYVYVLSDNWDIFNDSRIVGPVPFYKIEGIAIGDH